MNDTIKQIKEALNKSMPSPWIIWERSDSIQVVQAQGKYSVAEMDGGTWEMWQANAHLIANAPTWLQWAVEEIQFWRSVEKVQARKISTLESEHTAMKEALEWYAYKPNYSSKSTDPDYPYQRTPLVYDDGGERARSALSSLKEESENEEAR